MTFHSSYREIWIDLAKFFSIFLVVLFHTNPNLDGYLFDFLQLLRMPAFFLIAGLLFNMDKWNKFSDFFIHRVKRLLIPYFWFYIIFYALWLLIGRKMVGAEELAINPLLPIKEFIWGRPNIILGPYWFITCLFSMQIIFYFLKKYIHSNLIIILISILGYLACLIWDIKNIPWCIDKALLYMPFYAYANTLRTYNHTKFNHKYIVIPLLSIITFFILIIQNQYNISPYINHILYIMAGFCIMPLYIAICKMIAYKLESSKIAGLITYIGEYNIVTLALQNYIIGFIKIAGSIVLGINLLTTSYYSINILITLITIILSIGVAFLINRYIPFIIGKGNISRNKNH